MNSKVYKWCAVPLCKNTSKRTPKKVFVHVPNKKIVRDKWLKLARRNPNDVVTNSPLYFCEDHFDLPNDMENYMQYHVMGSVSQVRMKPGCMPHKFMCQPVRGPRTSHTIERPNIAKKRRKMILDECKEEFDEKCIVTEQPRSGDMTEVEDLQKRILGMEHTTSSSSECIQNNQIKMEDTSEDITIEMEDLQKKIFEMEHTTSSSSECLQSVQIKMEDISGDITSELEDLQKKIFEMEHTSSSSESIQKNVQIKMEDTSGDILTEIEDLQKKIFEMEQTTSSSPECAHNVHIKIEDTSGETATEIEDLQKKILDMEHTISKITQEKKEMSRRILELENQNKMLSEKVIKSNNLIERMMIKDNKKK